MLASDRNTQEHIIQAGAATQSGSQLTCGRPPCPASCRPPPSWPGADPPGCCDMEGRFGTFDCLGIQTGHATYVCTSAQRARHQVPASLLTTSQLPFAQQCATINAHAAHLFSTCSRLRSMPSARRAWCSCRSSIWQGAGPTEFVSSLAFCHSHMPLSFHGSLTPNWKPQCKACLPHLLHILLVVACVVGQLLLLEHNHLLQGPAAATRREPEAHASSSSTSGPSGACHEPPCTAEAGTPPAPAPGPQR